MGDEELQSVPYGLRFAEQTECSAFVFLDYLDASSPVFIEADVDDESLLVWLNKDLSVQVRKGTPQPPLGGLRLILLEYSLVDGGWYIQCMKKAARLLYKNMKAPCFVLKLPMSWWSHSGSLALLYNKETRITEAVFHSESNLLGFQLLKNIKKNAVDWTNPLSIALEVIQMVVAFFHSELEKLQQKLGRINEQTGQHNYANIPPTDPFKLDFLATTRSLNTLSQDAILMTATFTSLINVLDNLQKFKKATEDLEEDGHGCIEAIKIDERMDILRENCRSLLIEVKSLNKQGGVLIQVVYQFMAQKDAKVNIELAKSSAAIAKASKEDSAIMLELAKTSAAIAKSNKEDSIVMIELAKSSADIAKASKEDSAVMIELGKSSAAIAKSSKEDSAVMKTIAIETKRDSAAMKTMSILGRLFLPRTFIATVFSMPVFDWEEDGTPIMKPAFRYYWAVTLPLTLGILLAWSVTMFFPGKWAARWWKKAHVVKDLREDSGSTAS